MKKFMKMFGAAALLAGMMMVGGCGDDAAQTPTGQVVKGPVANAFVTYSGIATAVKTDANGRYAYNGRRVTTTGGTYIDLNGVSRTAPDMATPAGKTNVTPITTLFVNASPADKAKLQTLLGTASIDTVVTGTITGSTSVLVAKLNETIGEVLTQLKTNNIVATPAYLASVATNVGALTPAAITATGGGTTLANAVVNAVGAKTALGAPVTITAAIPAIVSSVVTIADKAKEGGTVPTTGSTGGTGGTSVN